MPLLVHIVPRTESPFLDDGDNESATLKLVGLNIDLDVKKLVAGMTMFGMYLLLCSIALSTLIKRRQKTLRTWLLLTALAITCALTTITCGLDIAYVIAKIQHVLILNESSPGSGLSTVAERLERYNKLAWLQPANNLQNVLIGAGDSGLLFIINDILAGWRAVSLWSSHAGRTILTLVLYFLIFCSFALWITFSVIACTIDKTLVANTDLFAVIGISCSTLSMASNLLATGMIGYIAYQHMLFASRRQGMVRPSGTKILILLTESGLLYAAIQIVRLGLTLSIGPSTVMYGSLYDANYIFQSASVVVTAMYTPALILIINYGYSVSDTSLSDSTAAVDQDYPDHARPPSSSFSRHGSSYRDHKRHRFSRRGKHGFAGRKTMSGIVFGRSSERVQEETECYVTTNTNTTDLTANLELTPSYEMDVGRRTPRVIM